MKTKTSSTSMICCSPIIQTFFNESVTTVGYTGNKPTVSVAYIQDDGSFIFEGVFHQIQITSIEVIIDHGGVESGYVKLITT